MRAQMETPTVEGAKMTPIERILAALARKTEHEPKREGREWLALCPAHDDHHPSLAVGLGQDGRVLLKCRSRNCSPEKIVAALGMGMPDLFPPAGDSQQLARRQMTKPQTLMDFCDERRLTPATLSAWGVRDEQFSGRPCLRFPTPLGVDRVKYLDGATPKTQWAEAGKGGPVAYGLANARQLGGKCLYIVNGEPSVWACSQEGVPAVCFCAGEATLPGSAIIKDLQASGFQKIRVVYDLDETGRAGALKLVRALTGFGLEAVVLTLPPELGGGGDVDDLHRREGPSLTAALEVLPELPVSSGREKGRQNPEALLDRLNALPDGASLADIEKALRLCAKEAAILDPLRLEVIREMLIQRLKALGVASPARMADAALPSPAKKSDGAQGGALTLSDPIPWPEPVDGTSLAQDLTGLFKKYVILPEGAAVAMALWALMAHAESAFDVLPLLALTSPEMQCGKSTALALLGAVVPRALASSNISPAAIYRTVEKYHPTLILDEAETFTQGGNETLRGILNSGHTRLQAFVVRVEGEALEPRIFSTWCPKVFALIGRLPATLEDRSITVPMKRRAMNEEVERLRLDRLCGETESLQRKAARWAEDHLEGLRDAEPDIPPELFRDRTRDNWRVLLAIADSLGGTWPSEARRAAVALAGGKPEESTASITLLEDIRAAFEERGLDRLSSDTLVRVLTDMEGHPWPEWRNGQPLTTTQLARLLKPFGIKPEKWRQDRSQTMRGYSLASFQDAFARYLSEVPQVALLQRIATAATLMNTQGLGEVEPATSRLSVATYENANSFTRNQVAAVADQSSVDGWREAREGAEATTLDADGRKLPPYIEV